MTTTTLHQVTMSSPHQTSVGAQEMKLRAGSRKALNKKAAEFVALGCSIDWTTYKTVEVER